MYDSTKWYIMNANQYRGELLADMKSNGLLLCKTSAGRDIMVSSGGSVDHHIIGSKHFYIYDTGNGYRNPKWDDDWLVVVDKINFNAEGVPSKDVKLSKYKLYVFK